MRHRDLVSAAGALVRDRGSQFVDAFDEVFGSHDVKILKCPVQAPVANAYVERWIGTLRRELLDRTIIWNRRQLERLVVDYIDHYNTHRPHRSLQQRAPAAAEAAIPATPPRNSTSSGRPAATGSSTNTGTPHDQPRHHFRHPHAFATPTATYISTATLYILGG